MIFIFIFVSQYYCRALINHRAYKGARALRLHFFVTPEKGFFYCN